MSYDVSQKLGMLWQFHCTALCERVWGGEWPVTQTVTLKYGRTICYTSVTLTIITHYTYSDRPTEHSRFAVCNCVWHDGARKACACVCLCCGKHKEWHVKGVSCLGWRLMGPGLAPRGNRNCIVIYSEQSSVCNEW